MSHKHRLHLVLICLIFLGLDFPRFKTGEEKALSLFKTALYHYNNREYSLAREKLLQTLTLKEDFPMARLYLARSLYQSGDWLDALKELEEIQKTNPKDSILRSRIEVLKLEMASSQNGDLLQGETQYFRSLDGSENRGFRFRNPVDLAVDSKGNLAILSFDTANLVLFNPNLEPVWVAQGGFARKLKGPVAMQLIGSTYYIADFSSDSLFLFDTKGNFLQKFGESGAGLNQFRGPSGITSDPFGNIYVSDAGNSRVLKFSRDLSPLFSFSGAGKGKLNQPAGMGYLNGEIYVVDKKDRRIVTFDPDGNFLREYTSPFFQKPRTIRFFQDEMVVSDEISGVLKYSSRNREWTKMKGFRDQNNRFRMIDRPFATIQDKYGYIYTADYTRHRVDVFAPKNYLLSNLNLEIEKLDSSQFPSISVFVRLKNRSGQDILGLSRKDFRLSENKNILPLFDLIDLKKWNARITVSLLYENTETFASSRNQFEDFLTPFFSRITRDDRVELIRAGRDSTKLMNFGVSQKEIFRKMRTAPPEATIDSGKSIHLALTNLTRELGPRAVFYLGSGDKPYSGNQYPLSKLAQFAKANGIRIFPILIHPPPPDDESWEYLAEESGGELILLDSDPSRLYDLAQEGKDRRYILSYESKLNLSLSGRWIPLELTVDYRNFGGKTQGGFFVP
jgi:hypothetical protein